MAIEDGVALAAVLPHDTPQDEINERLKIYEKCRYERAHKVQEYTRMSGRDQEEVVKSGKPLNSKHIHHQAQSVLTCVLQYWNLPITTSVMMRGTTLGACFVGGSSIVLRTCTGACPSHSAQRLAQDKMLLAPGGTQSIRRFRPLPSNSKHRGRISNRFYQAQASASHLPER